MGEDNKMIDIKLFPNTNKHTIYRSDRPETPEDWSTIKALGIKTILNLENDIGQVDEELSIANTYNIIFFTNPMSGIWAPHRMQLTSALYVMETATFPLLIHCRHGEDRTGIVCAAYRVKKQGWSIDKAYQECLEYGHSKYLWFWKKALRKL
jgi:tyrosine-protein phosphatase SIW14